MITLTLENALHAELVAQVRTTVMNEIEQGCKVLGLKFNSNFINYCRIEGCINGHYTLKFGVYPGDNSLYTRPRFYVKGEPSIRYTQEDAVREIEKIREASALARRVAS